MVRPPAALEGLREWLIPYTQHVIQRAMWDFTKGAQRGIEQMAQLIQDPDYYEKRKGRRKRGIESVKESQRRQESEQYMLTHHPTQEQLEQQIQRCEADIELWERLLRQAKAKMIDLQTRRDDDQIGQLEKLM